MSGIVVKSSFRTIFMVLCGSSEFVSVTFPLNIIPTEEIVCLLAFHAWSTTAKGCNEPHLFCRYCTMNPGLCGEDNKSRSSAKYVVVSVSGLAPIIVCGRFQRNG